MLKVVFTMNTPQVKKHSTRFEFEAFEGGASAPKWPAFKPSFYMPSPLGASAKRLRVTVEEIE
jgi:hypothetical protein